MENDFDEIAATIREMGWGDGKKKTRFWPEKKKRVREVGQVLPEFPLTSSVSWSSCRYRCPLVENILFWLPSVFRLKM